MKLATLSIAVALTLGGCASQNAGGDFYPVPVQGTNASISAFPVNLHGGQPYNAHRASEGMRPCNVTATKFTTPTKADLNRDGQYDDQHPMKLIAAACWL